MVRGLIVSVVLGIAACSEAQSVTEIPLSDPHAALGCIVQGPDGNLWFGERQQSKIGKLAPTGGALQEFPVSGQSGNTTLRMQCLTPGPDGNIWFTLTETGFGQVGKITPSGDVTLVTGVIPSRLFAITSGPDGNIWFTEANFNVAKIGKLTTGGTLTEYPVPSANNSLSAVSGIVAGPDGNLWFTEQGADKIGKITPAGVISEYPLAAGSVPAGIVAGPDGALWFTEQSGNRIGRMTTDGTLTHEYTIPTATAGAQGITAGADGNLWFAESAGNKIGRITPSGQITELDVPTSHGGPFAMTSAAGSIWFTEALTANIGQVAGVGPGPCVAGATTLCLNANRFKVEVGWSVPDQGKSGGGQAASLTGDTGYFWFFNDANIELVIKVLDARGVNGHFWVFYGALSDVAYTITVTDTQTNVVKTYDNPYHHLASFSDTSAFAADTAGTERAQFEDPRSSAEVEALSASELYALYGALTQTASSRKAAAAPCTAGSETLCLNAGRFQVTVAWSAPSQGKSGHGMAHPVTDDTGYLWFFTDTNVELVIKVLDGRPVNGHFWVFYGALSNVQYTVTVKDTETGATQVYENPDGHQASNADTKAF